LYFEALELGMLQIEWPGRIIAGARVCSAELLRCGPCLEGGFALPHRMGGTERMVFGLRPLEQMKLQNPGTRSRYESRLSHTFSKAPSAPLFTRKRFMAINISFLLIAKAGASLAVLITS
jgi:hypothetical protein